MNTYKSSKEDFSNQQDDIVEHINLGSALYRKGQIDESIVEFRKAIQINQENARAHLLLGIAFLSKKQIDESIAELRHSIRINPQNALTHYTLGIALCHAKDQFAYDEDAIDEFSEAIKINPSYTDAYFELGVELQARGRFIEAIKAFETFILPTSSSTKPQHRQRIDYAKMMLENLNFFKV